MKFGKLKSYITKGQKVTLEFETQTAMISVVTPKIIRVFCALEENDTVSKAIEGDKTLKTEVCTEEKEDGLWIHTGEVSVRVTDEFFVDFFDKNGQEVCMDYKEDRKPLQTISEEHRKLLESEGHDYTEKKDSLAFEIVKKIQGSEYFYGLGDKTGYLNKRNYAYEMWNTDNPAPQVDCFKALYKSIPFFMTLTDTHVYGIFMDNTYKSFFNMGQESEEYYYFGSMAGNLDYYYIAGVSLSEVLAGYTYLTGTCPVPQKWILGYHQSRWGYVYQEDIEEIANGMRDNDIPCDSIHFDIDYMEGYRVFTWNNARYHGDPDGYLKTLAERGFKPIVIVDPGVKKDEDYYVYQKGVEKEYFAKTPEGEIYVNEVWPGESVYPDFGKEEVRKWWGQNHKFLLDKGVRGIWNDMNEPASFNGPLPDDVVFSDEDKPSTHAKMHNVYGHLMAKATYEGLKEIDGKRPFVITRACYAGSQKYTSAWTGDNHSMWAHLQMAIPQLCNLGMSGMPFVGTDVGGFGSDTTAELLCRWVQVGCFSPFFRNHSAMGTRRQEPWKFNDEVLKVYRKYIKLRYKLLPYIYDLFFKGEKTGEPIMRPLVYHYEKDEAAKSCNDQFMLGESILVAPVVMQGIAKRMVYLPQGEWYDYWTKEKLVGPTWIVKDAPIDVCPMYVKAGSIIPTMEPMSYVGEKELDTLILDVYPGIGSYEHYLDDGEGFAYRDGGYCQYHFEVDKAGNVSANLVKAGYEKPYKKIVVNVLGETFDLAM